VRVIVNRDERRTRSLAWAPCRVTRSEIPLVWPTDADSLGTWVAVSGTGLVWALLNRHRGGPLLPHSAASSRGHVIPTLADASDLDEAVWRFGQMNLRVFAPFRLLITDSWSRAVCQWDGQERRIDRQALRHPEILPSSSLGDHVVESPREELFRDLLARYEDPWRAQDALHQHTWPDRRHLSVLMTREVARTVSRTIVAVEATAATMTYAPVVDGWIGPVVVTSLDRVAMPLAVPA
jgi:hypothetical protein